jgi:hypothetical protein
MSTQTSSLLDSTFREGELKRPFAPDSMFSLTNALLPAPELDEWMRKVFINEDGPLYSPRHSHLQSADLGCFWTTQKLVRGGIEKAAQVEDSMIRAGAFGIQRHNTFLSAVFGRIPDFLLTIRADVVRFYTDVQWLALIKHELCHMDQKKDAYGFPLFDKETGQPKFTIVGHDVEEFVDVVELFGAEACGGKVVEMVKAANKKPIFTTTDIVSACGTCK